MSAGTPVKDGTAAPTDRPRGRGVPPWLRRLADVNEVWTFGVLLLLVVFFTAARPSTS